jgi:hypothetical protein
MLTAKKMGGETAGKGSYRNSANDSAAILPGRSADCYDTVPPAVVIAAAPVLGLVYAVFLPFIGIAMLLSMAVRRIFGGLTQSAYRGAVFTWKPSEAYLAGKRGRSRRTISKKEEEKKE